MFLLMLPVDGGLDRVVDRRAAAVDDEEVRELAAERDVAEGLGELRVLDGEDVAVGRLVDRDPAQALAKGGIGELRMVVADRHRRHEAEEVEQLAAAAWRRGGRSRGSCRGSQTTGNPRAVVHFSIVSCTLSGEIAAAGIRFIP